MERGKFRIAIIGKSKHFEFQCVELPKCRIQMFGNCQNLKFHCFEKAKI